jgi:hypothetical protein
VTIPVALFQKIHAALLGRRRRTPKLYSNFMTTTWRKDGDYVLKTSARLMRRTSVDTI